MSEIVSQGTGVTNRLSESPPGAGSPNDFTGAKAGATKGLPRSDLGTVVLHWIAVIAMGVSLFTGLRISADALDAVVSKWFAPILPQGEIWSVHIIAGLALFGASTAYVVYMALSGLSNRIALRRIKVVAIANTAKLRWMGINVALHWLAYALIVVLAVTGILLFLGYGGWVVTVHVVCAFAALAYTLAHILAHFMYGGLLQLLRVLYPTALTPTPGQRSRRPLLVASIVAVPVAAGAVGLDFASRDTLTIGRTAAAPTLDGTMEDAAWRSARPIRVRTQQGVNLGGTGESTVEVRAVHDGSKIYFAFRWQDPTRSLLRNPLVKREDGWHVVATRAGSADVNDFYEDKFAVIFSRSNAFGGSNATHMGPRPVADRPSSLNERGLHYTVDGSYIDMWQWKASRGGLLGYVDDQYIGPLREATADEAAKRARYQGGYWNDPGSAFYSYNFGFEGPGGYAGPVTPRRLPKDLKAMQAAFGPIDISNPDAMHPEGAKTWMTDAESVPYSKDIDAAIPVGTVMPGVLIAGAYSGDRAHILAGARWADGYWTLETSRDLKTGSKYDADFAAGDAPWYMWVSVFDHTQTRHTRHVRPVTVVVE